MKKTRTSKRRVKPKKMCDGTDMVPYKGVVGRKKANKETLKIVCKLTGIKEPRHDSDANIIISAIIGILLSYSAYELSNIYSAATTDVLLTTSYSMSEFLSVLPTVLTRSTKLQKELLFCLGKRTTMSYLGSIIGYDVEDINVLTEMTDLVNIKIEFTKKEILGILSSIPENIGLDIDIEEYIDNKFNFVSDKNILLDEIENLENPDFKIKYKGMKEYCPTVYEPLNKIIDQELSGAVKNIKRRITNEAEIHQMMALRKANDIQFSSLVVLMTVILCLILFNKTFVISTVAKCLQKDSKKLKSEGKCILCEKSGHDSINCPYLLEE